MKLTIDRMKELLERIGVPSSADMTDAIAVLTAGVPTLCKELSEALLVLRSMVTWLQTLQKEVAELKSRMDSLKDDGR